MTTAAVQDARRRSCEGILSMIEEAPRGETRWEARAEARRRQILDAAEACFRARGFHAATMAEIATAAGLSVGQIYRFFENKEALIEAITDLQMDELWGTVAEVEARDGAVGAIRLLLAKGFDKLRRPGMAALLLEVTAEAARNPKVAAVVQAQDRRIREAISTLITKAQGLTEPDEADCRAEMMCLIFEGCAARVIRNPQLDDEMLVQLQDWLLARLLGELEGASCSTGHVRDCSTTGA
jgi:AcrR family transcriptional regulator